jgi:hypothetical protein
MRIILEDPTRFANNDQSTRPSHFVEFLEGIMRRLVVTALSLIAIPVTATAAPLGETVNLKANVLAQSLREPTPSTFTVDLAPGRSTILHRTPSTGYVVVHVLSGVIHAQAWRAVVGYYHAGETWVEPAFAYDITVVNASASAPARAFVVVVTGDDQSERLENTD